jgi:hypothetical protein
LNQGVEKDPKPGNNTSRITQIVRSDVDLSAALAIFSLDSAESDCNGNTKVSEYRGPGSQKLIDVTITNNGKSTATNPSFTIKRSMEAVAKLSEAKIDGQPFDLTEYCTALTTSITCALPNDLAAGKKVHVTYPITTMPSSIPNNEPGYKDVLTVTSDSPDYQFANNVASAPIRVGKAKSELCTTKTPVERITDVNPALRDGIHWAFKANGHFVYQITVNPPAGGHYADAQNVVVEDIMPIGLVPQSALSTKGSCAITSYTSGKTIAGSGTAQASAKHPLYMVSCDLGTISGNNPDGSAPTATIYVAGHVDSDAVQLYGEGLSADGWNWVSAVPNTATTTFSGARHISSSVATVDLVRRPMIATNPVPQHPATGVDRFTLLIAAGLLGAGCFLLARRRRLSGS